MAQKGVAVASKPLSARAGAEILAGGGNAVDAAVAMQFAMNVEEPSMNGIGGGGLILVYRANTREAVMLDSREVAPALARPDLFLDAEGKPQDPMVAIAHGNAVGTPGTLMGAATLLERYGTMPLAELMQPAIKMAAEGVPVYPFTAQRLHEPVSLARLSREPGRAYTLFRPDGTPLQEGDVMVQTDLANTFRRIAAEGIGAFYHGPIGEAIAAIVQERGGCLRFSDLESYSVRWRPPVWGRYRGLEIASSSPPSSGGLTLIQMLNLLERFEVGALGHNRAETLHLLIEAMHLAYADRARYSGDEDFVQIPKMGLLHPDYVASRSALIDLDRATAEVEAGDPWKFEEARPGHATLASRGEAAWRGLGCPQESSLHASPDPEGRETTHFVAADGDGNVVAWTSTIQAVWGSGIMVPGHGFLLNNEMLDFDLTPGGANQIEPLKRPRSSQSPTILFREGRPWMSAGSPGGPTIIATTLQVIMNVVDHGIPLQEAVNAPRIFSSAYPNVQWEPGIPEGVREELGRRGHLFDAAPSPIGSAQSILLDAATGQMRGAADPRRQGAAVEA